MEGGLQSQSTHVTSYISYPSSYKYAYRNKTGKLSIYLKCIAAFRHWGVSAFRRIFTNMKQRILTHTHTHIEIFKKLRKRCVLLSVFFIIFDGFLFLFFDFLL